MRSVHEPIRTPHAILFIITGVFSGRQTNRKQIAQQKGYAKSSTPTVHKTEAFFALVLHSKLQTRSLCTDKHAPSLSNPAGAKTTLHIRARPRSLPTDKRACSLSIGQKQNNAAYLHAICLIITGVFHCSAERLCEKLYANSA